MQNEIGWRKSTSGFGVPLPCVVNRSQSTAEVGMGLSQLRRDIDRLAICGNRLVELALRNQCIAEVGMGLSVVGLEPDRAPICRDRLVELALIHQRVAEPKMALGKIRLRC